MTCTPSLASIHEAPLIPIARPCLPREGDGVEAEIPEAARHAQTAAGLVPPRAGLLRDTRRRPSRLLLTASRDAAALLLATLAVPLGALA